MWYVVQVKQSEGTRRSAHPATQLVEMLCLYQAARCASSLHPQTGMQASTVGIQCATRVSVRGTACNNWILVKDDCKVNRAGKNACGSANCKGCCYTHVKWPVILLTGMRSRYSFILLWYVNLPRSCPSLRKIVTSLKMPFRAFMHHIASASFSTWLTFLANTCPDNFRSTLIAPA